MTYTVPTGGVSVAGPQALLAAIARGGVIQAGPGAYGVLRIIALAPATPAIVVCHPGAHFERIYLAKGSRNILFIEPRVWPDLTAPVQYNGVIHADASTSRIEICGAKVMSAPDGDNYRAWSLSRWQARQTHGIVLYGPDSAAIDCTVKAIRIGAIIANDRCKIAGLKVRGFSEDGWRVIEDADDCLIDSPDVADAVKIDATHPDGGQSWSEDASNVPGSGSIENLTVLNILFREWIGPAGHPLRRTDMQGIGFHNGTYRNLTIRGGEVWVGGWNGIRVARVTGGVIEGVKVLDPARKAMDRRIHVVGSTGVAIRNCIAGRVIIGQTDMTSAQMAAAGIVKPDYATLPAMSLVD